MSYLIGYKATYELFEHVKQYSCHKPLIMCSEDLYKLPNKTVRKLFSGLNMPFDESYLHWEDLGDDFLGNDEWHEVKQQKMTYHYHGDAIHSTHFSPPSLYEVDENGVPTFSEIENVEHREVCKKVYQENLPYYEKLINQSEYNVRSVA